MAGALAQRMREAGQLGAAYFCRHNDSTRNDPRYLLGTIALQLCDCNIQYKAIIGGEDGVKMLLANSKLGVMELFAKLLHEPLSKCLPCQQRLLVIIDALDETEYESREDFLDLIMHRFPLLPKWLVFFITSRPEDSVQFRLKKYNPCVKMCAGNSDQQNFYQQHEQDIQTFLGKRIDFSCLPYSIDDVSKKCNGLFLYAHYIVEVLRLSLVSGKNFNQLSDLFPGGIDDFFLQNFQRIYDRVGQNIFKKLFGCAIVAPSPLPVSIISYILKKENSNHNEQHVIDAVSQFVVLRTSDQTLTFLHNLVPAWLTDKKKARKLFIDKKMASEYFRDVLVEILSAILNDRSPKRSWNDVSLEGYVVSFAIGFLCQFRGKDSLKLVFNCLTNYHFLKRRMLSGKIEILHLLRDLKLVRGRLAVKEKQKENIVQEILMALESDVHILLEWPDLLHSCIRNASNAVQKNVLILELSAPWLEWKLFSFPNSQYDDIHYFAISPDKKIVAGALYHHILLFDATTTEKVNGPFEIERINHLEFSPDGKFIFFGRLDKWFSVEQECVVDLPQFSRKCTFYKWGVFTRDGQYIVVKKTLMLNPSTCKGKSCVINLLALWALKEIEQSQDEELTVCFSGQVLHWKLVEGKPIKRLLERLGIKTSLGQTNESLVPYDFCCGYCFRLKQLTEENQEPSLTTVRQLIIKLYHRIFQYQVWDLHTGMPILQECFSKGVQIADPLNYICHVSCAFIEWGLKLKCSGIDKAMSVCNIAVVNAVYGAILGRYQCGLDVEGELGEGLKREWELERKMERKWELELTCDFEQTEKLTWKIDHELKRNEEFEREQERKGKLVKKQTGKQWNLELEWKRPQKLRGPKYKKEEEWVNITITMAKALQQELKNELKRVKDLSLFQQKQDLPWDPWKVRNLRTIREWLVELELKRVPWWMKWKQLEEQWKQWKWYLEMVRERQWGILVFAGLLKEVNDAFNFDVYANISNVFSPFKFIPLSLGKPSVVRKSVALFFHSSEAFISVGSDLEISLWQTTKDKEGLVFTFQSILTTAVPLELRVEKCILSPDGKLMAIHHHGKKVELYSFAEPKLMTFLFVLFEAECEFSIPCGIFSTDSTLLLFCIQDRRKYPHFFVWDVERKVLSASFKSPRLLSVECCCLSSNKKKLILCGDYEIEIWEYDERPRRLLTRLGVERPYNSVKFSQCAFSSDDHFLVCCIANRILVYSLHCPDVNSSKRVLGGHLGRIEFCRFLKVNHYLISYDVGGIVFLWDIGESKAVGFAKIAQEKESIITMAVSPEEETAVCFISSGRVCVIRLCELGCSLPLKQLTPPIKDEVEVAETSLQLAEEITSKSQIPTSSTEHDDMAEDMNISDSEEDMYEYYLEHEVLDDSD